LPFRPLALLLFPVMIADPACVPTEFSVRSYTPLLQRFTAFYALILWRRIPLPVVVLDPAFRTAEHLPALVAGWFKCLPTVLARISHPLLSLFSFLPFYQEEQGSFPFYDYITSMGWSDWRKRGEASKKPDLSGFFETIFILSVIDGSGDVILTHDTPGMKACGDGVWASFEAPKPLKHLHFL